MWLVSSSGISTDREINCHINCQIDQVIKKEIDWEIDWELESLIRILGDESIWYPLGSLPVGISIGRTIRGPIDISFLIRAWFRWPLPLGSIRGS